MNSNTTQTYSSEQGRARKQNSLIKAALIGVIVTIVLIPIAFGVELRGFAGTGTGNGTGAGIESVTASPPAQAPASTPVTQQFQDVPDANPFSQYINRLYVTGIVSGYACGGQGEPCVPPGNRPYYRPANNVPRQQMAKFVDLVRLTPGAEFRDYLTGPILTVSNAGPGDGLHSINSYGVGGNGVLGESTTYGGRGVVGIGTTGVWGIGDDTAQDIGIKGTANFAAGYFEGDVYITGQCFGCLAPDRIDHPLDPENKYLYHSAVESPDMMNVYNGNVMLDAKGEATVQLPDWFGVLNKEYRYQLTAVGAPGPNLYISRKVENNSFSIAGGTSGMEVSWQVTGIRQDPYAEAHPIVVEEEKTGNEKGKYLHPTEYGQPESKGVNYDDSQNTTKP